MSKWNLVSLKEIVNNLDNKRVPLNSSQRELKESKPLYPYIGANNIMGYIDEYIFDEKILCVAEDGGSWGFNQRCAVLYNEKVWVNNHAHVLTAKENLVLEYLMYYLNHTDLNLYINGATRGKLTKSSLETIKIPLPPLPQQQKIANILDAADAVRQNDKALIAKYDELTQALFLDMFGDPVSNPKGWPVDILGNYCKKIQIGPFGSQLHMSDYVDEGIPLINPTNIKKGSIEYKSSVKITDEKYDSLPNYHLNIGDIVMARRGDLSKIGVVDREKSFCGTGSLYLRFKENINVVFCYWLLSHRSTVEKLYEKAQGVTMANLNKNIIIKLPIVIPPVKLQNQFAERLSLIQEQKAIAQASLIKSEELFNSLLQKAFKGEL
ncbi:MULTISPECIES: restriction endonuclease subunit S [unclassified Flavobacterium]|uniref:restriction endonuclease subunit S n=1 Tax=unclassified Flavobacterium TaxID=196869 RepID=UPI00131D3C8A|nr:MULTISPECIES: restriction endonuclease subunit S [unclassified Flavobacterium]